MGGDCHTGPKFAIDAIAAGKEAAISLHRFVQPGQSLVLGRDRRIYRALDKDNIVVDDFDRTPRQNPGHKKVENRFMDERVTFTPEQIRKETARCLQCGASKIDPFLCIGCGQRTTKCAFDAIHLEKRFDVQFPAFEQLPIKVAKNAVKRTGRIIKHTHIEKVVVEIGELSGVVPHYMETCFPTAVYKTPFEDLQMEMEIVPGILRCMNCQHEFQMDESRLTCPKCGSEILAPVSGTGFIIKEIYGS